MKFTIFIESKKGTELFPAYSKAEEKYNEHIADMNTVGYDSIEEYNAAITDGGERVAAEFEEGLYELRNEGIISQKQFVYAHGIVHDELQEKALLAIEEETSSLKPVEEEA